LGGTITVTVEKISRERTTLPGVKLQGASIRHAAGREEATAAQPVTISALGILALFPGPP
jgi:hypothetical protein